MQLTEGQRFKLLADDLKQTKGCRRLFQESGNATTYPLPGEIRPFRTSHYLQATKTRTAGQRHFVGCPAVYFGEGGGLPEIEKAPGRMVRRALCYLFSLCRFSAIAARTKADSDSRERRKFRVSAGIQIGGSFAIGTPSGSVGSRLRPAPGARCFFSFI